MRQRILAGAAAIVLVVVAVVVRGALNGGGSDGPRRSGSKPVVACTDELRAVCSALAAAGTIASNPPVVELGSNGARTAEVDDRRLDAWIAWDPSGAMANQQAGGTAVWGDPIGIGSSGVAAIAKDQLPSPCQPDDFKWACLATAAEGGSAIGVGDPTLVSGLLRLFPIARAVVPDLDFEDGESSPLRTVVASPQNGSSTVAEDLNNFAQPGFFNVLVGPAAGLADGFDTRRYPDPPDAAPSPMSVVVIPRSGTKAAWASRQLDESARAALTTVGVDPDVRTTDLPPGVANRVDWAARLLALSDQVKDQ